MKKILFVLLALFLFSIKGNALDTEYAIEGPHNVNPGDEDVYSIVPVDGIGYSWAVSGGDIVSGQGSSSITVNWTEPGEHDINVQVDTGNGIVIIDDNSM